MELTSNRIFNAFIHGANNVINHKELLNRINVFPVRDGDTGSNLASMMRTIIKQSESKKSVKQTLESIADAALYGARGNSGIIFAQYLVGLSQEVSEEPILSTKGYADASYKAVRYAYEAVENPIEGTIITVMREWGMALQLESDSTTDLLDLFEKSHEKLERTLQNTKEQLEVLKKADVVDSGAQGFSFFIQGIGSYLKDHHHVNIETSVEAIEESKFHFEEEGDSEGEHFRYCTECLLEGDDVNWRTIKEGLRLLGDSIVVAGTKKKCRVHIHTNQPQDVFEYLYSTGSVVFQKVEDMYRQKSIVNSKKANIALLTDSIADIPVEWMDEHQIHMMHLNILYKDVSYIDKLTIKPATLLEYTEISEGFPTSSQPSPKQIENVIDYLSTYYDSVIIITVSKELSGTYNNFRNVAKKINKEGFKIDVINSKQNSGAQGLLVKKCAELIQSNYKQEDIVKHIEESIEDSKILVQVRTIDNMIKSGRLSIRAGKIAKCIGLKPIVTLDKDGKGGLDSVAFSLKGSNKKLIKHIKGVIKRRNIECYNIVHVNNLESAQELANTLTKMIGFKPVYITETSSIVAIGAGQGAIAISYLLERRG